MLQIVKTVTVFDPPCIFSKLHRGEFISLKLNIFLEYKRYVLRPTCSLQASIMKTGICCYIFATSSCNPSPRCNAQKRTASSLDWLCARRAETLESFSHLFLFIFHGHLEPRERVPDAFLVSSFAEHGFDFLCASTQVHQLAGEVHALLHQTQVFVL